MSTAAPIPSRECDLVMKGGITSGVIYPLAICRLARQYRLRSIGGSSAGAIAAGAAAAAEYGRQTGATSPDAGFTGLEALPEEIGRPVRGRSRLLSLFQPAATTQPAFAVLLSCLGDVPAVAKVQGVLGTIAAQQWPITLAGGVGAAAALAVVAREPRRPAELVVGAVAALLIVAASLLIAAVRAALAAWHAIGENGGGICRGFAPDEPADEPGLTTWLADLLDRLAGRDPAGPPLTFAELALQKIDVQMMTTALTHGRPYRLPFADATFFFKEADFAALFPPRVVAHLRDRAAALLDDLDPELAAHARAQGVLPLPTHELPVVVGMRMSLSFPVLLSAVPLYAVDWTLARHPKAAGQATTRPEIDYGAGTAAPRFEVVWFSDGGICSNLPIHFFDSLVPTRPTFALNLRHPHPRYPIAPLDGTAPSAATERRHVWIPESNNAGLAERWTRIGTPTRLGIGELLGTMVDTMQSWNDNTLAKAPGFRDRIIHISHTEHEGGLNLDMSPEVIDRLSRRGEAAGSKLVELFVDGKGWDNHVWVRFRSALAMLEALLEEASRGRLGDGPHHEDLQRLLRAPPSYAFADADQAERARQLTELLRGQAATAFGDGVPSLRRGAPRALSELRARPGNV